MRQRIALALLLLFAALGGAAVVPLADSDMESPEPGPWERYGTPVTVEKCLEARTGQRALRVVTDNLQTMGGNFEGTARFLGTFEAGDLLSVSFWFDVKGSRTLVAGIGPTYFMQMWYLSGTDWTRADLSLRCPKSGPYTLWLSQSGAATEFRLDDFRLEVTKRPVLGTVPEADRVSLSGGPLRLTLCRRSGALCGIENLATSEIYAPVGVRQPLAGLELLSTDGLGTEAVAFADLVLRGLRTEGERQAELRFAVRDLPIELTVSMDLAEDGSVRFTGRVQNGSARPVLAVELPVVHGVNPARTPANLTLVDPYVGGRIVRKALDSTGVVCEYPGRAVMGWLDLSGEQGGVYLATHDVGRIGSRLSALPAPGPAFDLMLAKEVTVPAGESLDLPPAVLAVHTGDWHVAADRYRTWARSWLKPPDVPAWLRQADGWVLTGVQNGIPFRRLPDVYRSAEWMGIDYLHVQGEGIDNMWFDADGRAHHNAMTYLYPSPKFGTPGELTEAVRRIHARRGHVMFYFLYERWTPSHSTSDDFGTGRRRDVPVPYRPPEMDFYPDNALVESPGVKPPAEHPFMTQRIMCLAAPGWQEWMRRWSVDIYAKEYGADGMYFDVMGRNGPFRCFNARHGHRGESLWAAGCARVLDTVVTQGRRVNPDYSCAIEGCSDTLGPWVGFHLMSGATMQPNVFRYTFPEYLCVDGFSNTIWKLTQAQKAHRVFLDGERFDLHGYHQAVKRVLLLRKRLKPFLDWPAVFMDTLGLTVSDPRVQARAFHRTDGPNRAIALTLMNEKRVENATVEVDLQAIGRPVTVAVFHFDGRVEIVPVDGPDRQRVTVPPDDVAGVVLAAAVGSELAAVSWIEPLMTPGVDGARWTVFFPAGEVPLTTRAVNWPDGFRPVDAELARLAPCLRVFEYRDPAGLAGLRRWERVDASLAWRGGESRPWTVLAPPLVNGGFEETDEAGLLVHWGSEPCTENPGQGKACLRLEGGSPSGRHATDLAPIKPACRYRFSAMVRRAGSATGWAGAHVIEYEEGSKFVRSAVLNSSKKGVWETLTTTFTSHANPRTTAIYLYNFDEKQPAWFDGLELEEVRQP